MKEPIRFAVGDQVHVVNKEKKAAAKGELVVKQVVRLKSGEIRYVVVRKVDQNTWRSPSWRVGFADIEKDD